jgi:hypothetical protein
MISNHEVLASIIFSSAVETGVLGRVLCPSLATAVTLQHHQQQYKGGLLVTGLLTAANHENYE